MSSYKFIAEEEAAKRARIQERLAQSLGTKNAEPAKGTKSAPTSHDGQCKPPMSTMNEQRSSRVTEKQKLSEKKVSKTPHHQSSSRTSEADRKPIRPSLEPSSKNRDTKSKKPVEKVRKNQVNGKKGAPLNFKELLAAAERNKLGGPKLQSVVEQHNSSKNNGSNGKSSSIKKRGLEEKIVKQDKTVKHNKTAVSTDSTRPSKSVPNGKSLPSGKDSSMKKDLKRSPGVVNGSREKPLEKKTKTSLGTILSDRKLGNPRYNNPAIERRLVKAAHLSQSRERANLKRKRNPYEDEMDDFIDDGEGEDAPDVSKYIREIFGYDKTRFASLFFQHLFTNITHDNNIVRPLKENFKLRPCSIDQGIARSIRQRFVIFCKDQTSKVNKLFIVWLVALTVQACNKPAALQDNNTLELASVSALYRLQTQAFL